MKSNNSYTFLLQLAKSSMGDKPSFSGYLSFILLYVYLVITYKILTNTFVILLVNFLIFAHIRKSTNTGIHIFILSICTLSIFLFIFRFWKWLKEPVFYIDGQLPDDKWYNSQIKIIDKQLEKEEITRLQARVKTMGALGQTFAGHKGLKHSIPKNPFKTFTSKTIKTVFAVAITYAMVYHTLYSINNSYFQIAINPSNINWFTRFIDFIYFSFVTFATIGYGDIFASATISKVYVVGEIFSGIIILIVGIAALSLFTLPKVQEAQEAVAKRPIFEKLAIDKDQDEGRKSKDEDA